MVKRDKDPTEIVDDLEELRAAKAKDMAATAPDTKQEEAE